MASSVPPTEPPPNHDDDYFVCLTSVVSHAAIIPALLQLYRRGWTFEFILSTFAAFVSFMYHFCQAFHIDVFLRELRWHRLDNIGVLSCFGVYFVHLCQFKDPYRDMLLRYAALIVALLAQEKAPWKLLYTFVPILSFGLLPIAVHIYRRRLPQWDVREVIIGFASLAVAIPFFVLGLDDDNDPFRIFHGMWHVLCSFSSLHLWRVVKAHPSYPNQHLEKL